MNTIYNILSNCGPKIEPEHIPEDCVALDDSEPTVSDNIPENYRTRADLSDAYILEYANQNVFVSMTNGQTYVGRFEADEKFARCFTVGNSDTLGLSNIQNIRVV